MSARTLNGVSAGTLMTTVAPTARAGPTLRQIIPMGKFQGHSAATTPTGWPTLSMWSAQTCGGNPGITNLQLSPVPCPWKTTRNRAPIQSQCFPRVPLKIARRVFHLGHGIGEGFAVLQGHLLGQIFLVCEDELVEVLKQVGTKLRRRLGESLECLVSSVDRLATVLHSHVADRSDHLARSRISICSV